MITPEMIEAHRRKLFELADIVIEKHESEAALTAALALHKPAMLGEIEDLIAEVLEPRSADHKDRAQRVAAALRSLVLDRDNTVSERDIAVAQMKRQSARIAHLEAALAEARNKAIGECALTPVTVRGFGTASDDYLNGFHDGALAKTDSIRALATGETKPSEDRDNG